MNQETELIQFNTDDRVRFGSRPYVVLRANGSSYINSKAASLLEINPGDVLGLMCLSDFKSWYLTNNGDYGANLHKNRGLLKFCDLKSVRKIFEVYEIDGVKAHFLCADKLTTFGEKKGLYIIPKPYNLK